VKGDGTRVPSHPKYCSLDSAPRGNNMELHQPLHPRARVRRTDLMRVRQVGVDHGVGQARDERVRIEGLGFPEGLEAEAEVLPVQHAQRGVEPVERLPGHHAAA